MLASDSFCVSRNSDPHMEYEWIENRLGPRGNNEGKPTRADLARYMKIGPDKITRIFNGEREVSPDEIIKIARFFNISIEEAMTGNSSKSSDNKNEFEREATQDESDMAFTFMFKMLFKLLIQHQLVASEGLAFNFSEAFDHYQGNNLPHAAHIMQKFREFVTSEPRGLEKEAVHKLLGLVPLGSA